MDYKSILKYFIIIIFALNFIKCEHQNLTKFKVLNQENFKLQNQNKDVDLISSAIFQVIDKFFIHEARQFKISIYGKISSNLNDVISCLGKKINENVATEMEHYLKIDNVTFTFRYSAVILTSDVETLNKINNRARLGNWVERSLRFIVYCDNWDQTFIDLPFFDWFYLKIGHLTIHEYIVTAANNSIDLRTFRYFTEIACRKFQIIKVDKFDLKAQKWINKLENIDNGRQLFGCTQVFSADLSKIGFYVKKIDRKNSENLQLSGLFYEFNEILSQRGNFSSFYQIYDGGNLISTQVVTKKMSFEYVLVSRLTFRYFIHICGSQNIFLALTPNELYTNYEKIFMPFDFTSWILFGASFVVVLTAISAIKKLSREIKNLFFGEGINSPIYDAIGSFFGISQVKLPVENFPRILIVFFLYFCLVFRTCYQGRMFDFMTSDMRKSTPENLEEMIERGYTVYMPIGVFNIFENEKIIIKWLTVDEFIDLYCKNINSNNATKGAFISNKYLESHFSATCGAISERKIVVPYFDEVTFSIGMDKNSILYDLLFDTMEKLFNTGILQYLFKTEFVERFRQSVKIAEDTRRIFSLDDLEYGFVLWLIACGISIIVFLIELVVSKFKISIGCWFALIPLLYGLKYNLKIYRI